MSCVSMSRALVLYTLSCFASFGWTMRTQMESDSDATYKLAASTEHVRGPTLFGNDEEVEMSLVEANVDTNPVTAEEMDEILNWFAGDVDGENKKMQTTLGAKLGVLDTNEKV